MTIYRFDESYDDAVAVIGMSLRAAGAQTADDLWQIINDGTCTISTFTKEEQKTSNVSPATMANPDYVPKAGIIDDIEMFDAGFFGFTPREADCLPPQNRLLFECAWEAMENGGQNPREGRGRTGLFVGQSTDTYWPTFVAPNIDDTDAGLSFYSNPDFLATGVAYKLNLRGPAMTVQSFCSTSLLAVHIARQSLLEGECDMALAGGTSVRTPQHQGYTYVPESVFSPDGVVRAFDARANGTLFSNGVGVVLLKRLRDAIEDGDPILSIIRGSAANNDGSSKAGYNAPSIDGQARAVARAIAESEVSADSIGYVECHGTGTLVGDPIEIAALGKAYRRFTHRNGYCAVGSLKPNMGHLDRASGVFGLIKATLALQHGKIPKLINYNTPNPRIDFASSPFYVAENASDWPESNEPRRAGVNSLGYGGTNVHVILEEAPGIPERPAVSTPQLLILSARTASSLKASATTLADHLTKNPDIRLDDVAHTLQVGRHGFNHRLAIIANDIDDAITRLNAASDFQETCLRDPVVFDQEGFFTSELTKLGLHAADQCPGADLPCIIIDKITDAAPHHTYIDPTSASGENKLLWLTGQLWLRGVNCDWSALPGTTDARRIALPTVRFERSHHWLDAKAGSTAEQIVLTDNVRQTHEVPEAKSANGCPRITAVPGWQPVTASVTRSTPSCRIIVLDEKGVGAALAEPFEKSGETVLLVQHAPGGKVANLADGLYCADLTDDIQIQALLTRLKIWGPSAILCCLPLNDNPNTPPQEGLKTAFLDPISWVRAVEAVWPNRAFDLDFLTTGMAQVSGGEPINPIRATLGAVVLTAQQEYPNITLRCLDLDARAMTPTATYRLADDVRKAPEGLLAKRGNRLWRPETRPVALLEPVLENKLVSGGVYVVIGGLGGVGWTIAKYLARQVNAKLVIIGRSIPALDDTKPNRAAERLRSLQELSPEVLPITADISDQDRLAMAIAEARAHFGHIHGVIHATHDRNEQLIRDLEPTSEQTGMAAKVFAVPELISLLRSDPPDFLVLCSSLAARKPGRGQVVHAANCAVLDAIAQTEDAPFPIMSVNWCSWRDIGVAHDIWITPVQETGLSHPILEKQQHMANGSVRYVGTLDASRHWVVREHILNGLPTLPGTAVIDLLLTAHRELVGEADGIQGISIEPLVFLSALQLDQGATKQFVISLMDSGDGVLARIEGVNADGSFTLCARGVIKTAAIPEMSIRSVDLTPDTENPLPTLPSTNFLKLGDRWNCLTLLKNDDGKKRAMARLGKSYQGDMQDVTIHPALLDMVASIHAFSEPKIPVGYGAFRQYAPFGDCIVSVCESLQQDANNVLRLNLQLLDEEGALVGVITDLTLAPVEQASQAVDDLLAALGTEDDYQVANPFLADSISPEEGIEVFRHLPLGIVPQILVGQSFKPDFGSATMPRAVSLNTPDTAKTLPSDPVAFLAQLWQRILGANAPDNDTSFFDQGGNSLAATRLLSRIRHAFGVTVAMKDFFTTPTINGLLDLVTGSRKPDGSTEFPAPAADAETTETDSEDWESDVL
tara:strand:+ start:232529 stop:237157 length:4629 start_codon:yes stop_codon:yes gene_type:complete